MQFFPAVDIGPGYSFLGNSRGGSQETTASQDFSDHLSKELEEPAESPMDTESGLQAESPAAGPEARPGGEAAEEFHEPGGGAEERGSAAGHRERSERTAPGDPQDREVQAKAAGREGQEPEKDAPDAAASGENVEGVSQLPKEDGAAVADDAMEVQIARLEAALAGLVRAAASRVSTSPETAAGIETLKDLMRHVRESAPSERTEMAAALKAAIKAMREELAGESSMSTKAGPESAKVAGEGSTSGDAFPAARAGVREAVGGVSVQRSAAVSKPAGSGIHGSAQPGAKASESAAAAGKDFMASAGKGPAEVVGSAAEGTDPVARQANAGANPGDKPLDAAKAADAVSSAGKAVGATTDPAPEAERPMDARHGERMAMNAGQSRAVGGKSDTAAMEAVRTIAQDGTSREAAKTAAAPLANMADAGRKVGEKGQPQQISADKPQEGDAVTRASAPSAQSGGERKSHDARDGFFGARGEDMKASARSASTSGKIVLETEAQLQGAGQNTQANVAQRLEVPVGARSAEVYRQVEGGAFRNLGQGVRQLVIRLDPADLGQVSVILRVKGKEIQAVLRASSQETSQILGEQVAQLRTQLEAQGLKVGKLEVQTQLADSQSQSQWQGAEQHNRYQENRELAMSAQRWRTLERMDSGLVRDVQNTPQREKLSSGGLDIFA